MRQVPTPRAIARRRAGLKSGGLSFPAAALTLAACVAAHSTACGAPALCTASAECPTGLVCGHGGACAPLDPDPSERFAASMWLTARDWGQASAPRGIRGDVMRVGGAEGRESFVAFGPLPEGATIVRALLVLTPRPDAPPLTAHGLVAVEVVGRFRGGALPPRAQLPPISLSAARRAVGPGPARPLRFDVTAATRAAAGGALYLALRAEQIALEFASPFALSRRDRPRLELLVN